MHCPGGAGAKEDEATRLRTRLRDADAEHRRAIEACRRDEALERDELRRLHSEDIAVFGHPLENAFVFGSQPPFWWD